MESEVRMWLKHNYQNAEASGPECKRMKFSDIVDVATSTLQPTINPYILSRAIKAEFPNTVSRKKGKKRQTYVYGLESSEQQLHQSLRTTAEMRNEVLEKQVKELEQKVAELEQKCSLTQTLNHEMQTLLHPQMACYHGPNTVNNLTSFSLDAIMEELRINAPNVVELLSHLASCERFEDDVDGDHAHIATLRTMSALCTLLKGRSVKVLGLQLLLSFMLIARATSKQVMAVLNHAGVCVSYTTAWKYLQQITSEARYLDRIREGHWMWAYDNLNIYQRVRHERYEHHSTMTNLTSRLAVKIRYLPDFNFSWSDCTPQRTRSSLTIDDFLPSESDLTVLKERAVHYIMTFLVDNFPCLKHLHKLVPTPEPLHPVLPSEVVPMKILFKDEKYKSETIDILTQLLRDAGLSGDEQQLVIGDQMTCKNIRGCKLWRVTETQAKDKLSWSCETPGDFHFLWECLKVIFLIFWGTPAQTGSLSNMRELVRRLQVDKNVKVFNVGDEFLIHTFKAQLLARILYSLKLTSISDTIKHDNSLEWLKSMAENLVRETIMPADEAQTMNRAFLHMAFLYIDLRNSIRYEDGPHVVRHYKLWLPRFIGTGRRNYAVECINVIGNLCADFPKHLSYIATHNRTVNISGKIGHGKPIDQMVEHYNLIVKQAIRAGGSTLNQKHVEDISLSGLFLMKVTKRIECEFGVHHSTSHTTSDCLNEINKIVDHLTKATENSPLFTDPTVTGLQKIFNTAWIKNTLNRSELFEEPTEDTDSAHQHQIADIMYELTDTL